MRVCATRARSRRFVMTSIAKSHTQKQKGLPDAVQLLTQDHKEVSALFKKYEKLAEANAAASDRQAHAEQICTLLTVHATIEEEIFYPAARAAGLKEALMDEADVEHAAAKDLIAQIRAMSPDEDHYDAKVKVLGEQIEHHVEEEQDEMFPKCRAVGMNLAELGSALAARKAALLEEAAEEIV
jgi:hemerythrin superfamily protein